MFLKVKFLKREDDISWAEVLSEVYILWAL